jgi:hypothetical protein
MAGVLRAERVWVEASRGLRIDQFGRLLRAVRARGGDGCGWGRPWRLPLAEQCQGVTVLGDGACINIGLIVPHRKRPGRPLLKGEKEDNAAHRKVRARVEHVIGRMKNYKILRDCRQRGDGLHHAVQAGARMHNLALAA